MDLIKTNIHMDHTDCRVESQFTLDEDCNVSDSKADISRILLTDGIIKIEEVRAYDNQVLVRGKLVYQLLYEADDSFGALHSFSGKIPFEERINADCIASGDNPLVTADLEHIHITTINSRKVNVQALVLLTVLQESVCSDEISTGVTKDEPVEYRLCNQQLLSISVMKKDICRIRDEVKLPANLPSMAEILWSDLSLSGVEFKPVEEKLNIKGDLNMFLIYRPGDDASGYEFFETSMPFSHSIECNGSKDYLIPDISYTISQKDCEIRPDLDGEERVIGFDVIMDLYLKLYEDMNLEYICDVYGVHNDLNVDYEKYNVKTLLAQSTALMRMQEKVPFNTKGEELLQMKYSNAQLFPESATVGDNCVEITGYIAFNILYITDDDRFPYRTGSFEMPFSYSIDLPGISPQTIYQLNANLEQCQVTSAGSDSLDVKVNTAFRIFAYDASSIKAVSDIEVSENDCRGSHRPGIAVYFVKEGDCLWNIGKEYRVPLSRIKEQNALTTDTVRKGQKLIVMK